MTVSQEISCFVRPERFSVFCWVFSRLHTAVKYFNLGLNTPTKQGFLQKVASIMKFTNIRLELPKDTKSRDTVRDVVIT